MAESSNDGPVRPPDFSIIIPFLDPEPDELRRAVRSVASQQSSDLSLEIVAVDDGSSDVSRNRTAAIFAESGLSVTVVRHERNRGLAAARNSGISAAGGDYLLLLDADDWLHDGALARLKAHLATHPAPLTYTLSTLAREASGPGARAGVDHAISKAFEQAGKSAASPAEMPELSLAMSAWAHVYRRDFFEDGPQFDPVQRRWEDRPFIVAAHLATDRVSFCPVELHAYFVGDKPGAITRRPFDRMDLMFMSRHIRHVEQMITQTPAVGRTGYADQHFWQSLARFYTVIGGALLPIAFRDRVARKLALGTAGYLYRRHLDLNRNSAGPTAPHKVLMLARLPAFMRQWLISALNVGNSKTRYLFLLILIAGIGLMRRVSGSARS